MRLQPPAPLETAPAGSGAVSDGPPRQRSGAPPSHLQPVDQGPAFRLARKDLPHGRSRQSSEGPQRSAGPAQRVDGRDRPCVVNVLRAQRGPYPVAPPTGLNPPTLPSGEPQFCPQILRKTRIFNQELLLLNAQVMRIELRHTVKPPPDQPLPQIPTLGAYEEAR